VPFLTVSLDTRGARRGLTVAEEDGVEGGEDRAGVHEPLPSPPLALGRQRPPPPLRPSVRLSLLAPIENRVLVPAAIGRCPGARHRRAPRSRLPGGVSSPRIGARSGDHQWPAPPRAPEIQWSAREVRGCRCGVGVLAPFRSRVCVRGRCYFIFLEKGHRFHL
jgi:hypothetical protein